MRALAVALVGLVALGCGVLLGFVLDDERATPAAVGLPAEVEATRAALLDAAESGDYAELAPLVPDSGFSYSFGGPVEGGAVAYWRRLGTEPIESLERILRMPYVLSRGVYVWPWAFTVADASALSAHERELLAPLGPLGDLFVPGYLGWRAGIAPDGSWRFFVAGD